MGAYSELIVSDPDGSEREIQFKLGLSWQQRYRLNDEVEFLDGQSGRQGRFEITGISGERGAWRYFALLVEDGRITAVRPISEGEHDRLEAEVRTRGL